MKVILIEDLPKLGEVGDVCEVADGYARNYLIPQGLAIVATEGALRQVENLKRQEARRRERIRGDAVAFKEQLDSLTLVFQAKVGETGRLYGSITSGDIAERIEELTGREVDRRKVVLDNPLKELGTFRIPIRLLPDVVAEVTVVVEGEAEEEPIVLEEEEEPTEEVSEAEDIEAESEGVE
jgi:large subunit ribosomal protein L9